MKIKFVGIDCVPVEEQARRKPILRQYPRPPRSKVEALAVVGGGPSAAEHIDAIRGFDAVWAINGAVNWCYGHGIDATLFTIDPLYEQSAERAYLADICKPELAELCGRAYVFPLEKMVRGTTTATTAPHLAVTLGHKQVHFFGCEGSFGETTHTFKDLPGNRLWLTCNGQEWVTNPQMLMQCEILAAILRQFPTVYFDRSGGLLGAMIADPEYDITAASQAIHDAVKEAS